MAKKHSFVSRILSSVLAFSLLVTATIGLTSTKASAASGRVFSDDKATVVICDDGSGTIVLKDGVTIDRDHPLKEIAGVPLKDIIKFNDGGYIDQIFLSYECDPSGTIGDIIDYTMPWVIRVHGRGPSGLFNGSGHLHFTDKTNDTYDLAIWSSSEKWHHVGYNSDNAALVKISWNS